jgi:hypothetical protein
MTKFMENEKRKAIERCCNYASSLGVNNSTLRKNLFSMTVPKIKKLCSSDIIKLSRK